MNLGQGRALTPDIGRDQGIQGQALKEHLLLRDVGPKSKGFTFTTVTFTTEAATQGPFCSFVLGCSRVFGHVLFQHSKRFWCLSLYRLHKGHQTNDLHRTKGHKGSKHGLRERFMFGLFP